MNYRHEYHAGNFADVFKHVILTWLLEKLIEKPTPFCVVDTHAGCGYYDLQHGRAQKTLEFTTGVERILNEGTVPPLLSAYREMIELYNPYRQPGMPVRHYPGSPLITAKYLRPIDRLVACEYHPEDVQTLSAATHEYPNVHCFHEDAYAWLNSQLPPKEKRGLVFIDPPYEDVYEFKKIIRCLKQCYPKFSHGTYAIWYPIKTRYPIKLFHNALRTIGASDILIAELCLQGLNEPNRLNGCGIAFINPPWQLEEKLRTCLPELHSILGEPNVGLTQVSRLTTLGSR